jgi:hypothetical protein
MSTNLLSVLESFLVEYSEYGYFPSADWMRRQDLLMDLFDGLDSAAASALAAECHALLSRDSLLFWERGYGIPGSLPPGGWSALSLAGISRYVEREGVSEELARRAGVQPGQVWVLASRRGMSWRGRTVYSLDSTGTSGHDVFSLQEAMGMCPTGTPVLSAFHAAPHPDGWWTGKKFCGPRHYEALQLVQAHTGGGLDVSRVLHMWTRDEFTGEGHFRLYKKVETTDSIIFCDARWWALLDAFKLLDDAGVLPAGSARLPAKAIRLGGRMRIVPPFEGDTTQQTLVSVYRKGPNYGHRDRLQPVAHAGCPAFVHDEDCWLPTHQEWSGVAVALTEGDVLPLRDGRGITLKGGKPYLVPGMARSVEHHVWAQAIEL